MKAFLLAVMAMAAFALVGCSSPRPAARVHHEMAALGYRPRNVVQGRADIAAARAVCTLRKNGESAPRIVADLAPSFYGNRTKTAAFVATAISAYCPSLR